MRNAAPPPVRSTTRHAEPRVLLFGLAAIAVAVVAVVLGILLTRSSAKPQSGAALPGAADAVAMYRGIPQHGLTLGSPHAPVHVVEFIDLQCPICRDVETTRIPDLVARYVHTGKAQLELRPWAFIGPDSARGQAALFAAADQNKGFEFMQVLYANQGTENTGWLTDDMIRRIAGSVPGLDVQKLLADRGKHAADAATVARAAAADNVGGTPAFFVDGRPVGPDELDRAVAAALAS